jgi:hypothetical protein
MTDKDDEPIVGMYEVLDALEAAIASADATKRKALAESIDAYHDDFPDDFHWALGAQSPTLLYHLFMSIDTACRPPSQSKTRAAVRLRLVDRKPEGNT